LSICNYRGHRSGFLERSRKEKFQSKRTIQHKCEKSVKEVTQAKVQQEEMCPQIFANIRLAAQI